MKKKRTKPMTAAELMAQLNADPEHQAFVAERDQRIQEAVAKRKVEEAPILADLGAVGVHVESVWDLVNTASSYPAAIPVLLNHMVRPYSEKTKEGIARSLAVPEAAEGWDILLSEFETSPDTKPNGYKWGIGCALAVVAAATGRQGEALRLLRDERHGENRLALLDVFALSRKPEQRAVLQGFADDPDLGKQVRWHLKNPGRRSK